MNEEEFFAANNFLNSAISDRYKNGPNERNDFIVYYAANDIINSNGVIYTDNEELREAFNKVYEVALDIKKYYDEVSEKAKLITDENVFDENSHNYLVARKQLIITYRKAYVATHEAFKKMFKHPEM